MCRINYFALIAVSVLMYSPLTKAFARDFQPVLVADGIYMVKGIHEQMNAANLGAIGNSGFIVGSRSVAVIDPGGSPEAGALLAQSIKTITDLPITHAILTHFHPDHVAGLSAFSNVRHVIAHENYSRALTQRAQFYRERFSSLWLDEQDSVFGQPTQTVAIGQPLEIDLGERRISIEAYPLAHTDNDLTLHDLSTNTLWASDLVFFKRTPALDGSLVGWLDVMALLESRSYELIIPGHGSPGSWEKVSGPQLSYLKELQKSIKHKLKQGVALSEVLFQHDNQTESTIGWVLYSEQHGSNLAKAYSELEWEY